MNYQICAGCVMDTTDPKIWFDEHGVYDHCRGFRSDVLPKWHPNDHGKALFRAKVAEIKRTVAEPSTTASSA